MDAMSRLSKSGPRLLEYWARTGPRPGGVLVDRPCSSCGCPLVNGACALCHPEYVVQPGLAVIREDVPARHYSGMLARRRRSRSEGKVVRVVDRAAEARGYRERHPDRVAASKAAWRAKQPKVEPKRSPEALERRRATARERMRRLRANKG